jgi:hypothetical protein
MPFHKTLLAMYRGTTDEDVANNITDDIPYIHDVVSNIFNTNRIEMDK